MNHTKIFSDSVLETIQPPASTSAPNVTQTDQLPADSVNKPVILPSKNLTLSAAAADIFTRFAAHQKLFRFADRVVELSDPNGALALSIITPAAFCSRLDSLGTVMEQRCDPETKAILLVPCTLH